MKWLRMHPKTEDENKSMTHVNIMFQLATYMKKTKRWKKTTKKKTKWKKKMTIEQWPASKETYKRKE